MKACVFGNEPKASDEVPLAPLAPRTEPAETTPTWQALKLLFCAVGLQVGTLAGSAFIPGLLLGGGSRDSGIKVFTLPVPTVCLVVCYVPPFSESHCTTIVLEMVGDVYFLSCDFCWAIITLTSHPLQ